MKRKFYIALVPVLLGSFVAGGATVTAQSQDPGSDPNAVIELPEQPFSMDVNVDDLKPTRGNDFYNASAVVEGTVEDFQIYRLADAPEIPASVKAADHGVQGGLHQARWRVRVTRTLKGDVQQTIDVVSSGFEPIIENGYRNPYLEGNAYRFYLTESGLRGNFFVPLFAESPSESVPTPEAGPIDPARG